MTQLSTRLINTVKDKGWLYIASVCFDNSNVLSIVNSSGYVAISESENAMFWLSNQDTADSENVFNSLAYLNPNIIGHHVTLVDQDLDCLQHFEYSLYSRMNFYWDEQDAFPAPKIPTKAEIMALEKDEETGLYPGTDELFGLKKRYNGFNYDDLTKRSKTSTISMYSDDQFTGVPEYSNKKYMTTGKAFFEYDKYPEGIASEYCGSGVNIDGWKTFYKNQEKFVAAMKTFLGIYDLV